MTTTMQKWSRHTAAPEPDFFLYPVLPPVCGVHARCYGGKASWTARCSFCAEGRVDATELASSTARTRGVENVRHEPSWVLSDQTRQSIGNHVAVFRRDAFPKFFAVLGALKLYALLQHRPSIDPRSFLTLPS